MELGHVRRLQTYDVQVKNEIVQKNDEYYVLSRELERVPYR